MRYSKNKIEADRNNSREEFIKSIKRHLGNLTEDIVIKIIEHAALKNAEKVKNANEHRFKLG